MSHTSGRITCDIEGCTGKPVWQHTEFPVADKLDETPTTKFCNECIAWIINHRASHVTEAITVNTAVRIIEKKLDINRTDEPLSEVHKMLLEAEEDEP